ncbi:MAG: response regulator [Geminicoccaceae bacterium]
MVVQSRQLRKILIVDDSSLARNMGRKLLSQIFTEATFAEGKDVESGFEAWKEARPDLSILDLNMPGGNGLDLAERILAEDPEAEIILCTANIQDVIKERASDLGIGFLNKPIALDKLEALMEQKAA